MRDAYASGKVHIGWATLDMLPLFMDELKKDPRIMPRVFQQVDFSNGGDGIVIRRSAAKDPNSPTISDLKGKKVVLAQNSPSEYFLLNALVNGGVQPGEVEFIYTEDAFQAAAAFNARQVHRRLRLVGAGHLQPQRNQGQPHAGEHRHRQQAHRRRLVRPRRLRPRPHGHLRGPRARHLRRHGENENRRRQESRPPPSCPSSTASPKPTRSACSPTPTRRTTRRTASSS